MENNLTKALVNTLEHSSPTLALKFLGGLLGITASGKVEAELQMQDLPPGKISRASQRLLLGLVAKDEKKGDITITTLQEPADEDSQDSRPDAWLYGDDFVVLIESKVEDEKLDPDQMRCHFRKLQEDTRQPMYKALTWAEVHQFFVTLLPELKEKDKWLLEQFTQYLEGTGMNEFTGFKEDMFEFFVHDEKDVNYQKWIRNTMGRFGEKILGKPGGLKALNPFYATYHVGNFGPEDDHFWVAFGPENFTKFCHQTISLYDYGLDIFVNMELLPVVKKLRKKIHDENEKFREIISGLPGPEPFRIQVEERKSKGRPRAFDYNTIAILEAGTRRAYNPGPYGLKDPQSSGFGYLKTVFEQIQYPYLSVRKRIDRKHVLQLSKGNGDALVEKAVRIMKEFDPLVKFINERN